MRYFISLLLLTAICCSSCTKPTKIQKTEFVKTEFNQHNTAPLVHIVLLKVKENAAIDELILEIQKLSAIPEVKNLEVGTFKDLGDTRALSEYAVLMQMRFENEPDYQVYQKHPIHLALKENTKLYLAGPPVTYDYLTK